MTLLKNALRPQKSAFFEAINTRGVEQLSQLFTALVADASKILPAEFAHLGTLVSIDGSLIDAVLSMEWADYRGGAKKAKAHVGFDINRGIPTKIFLTDGKEGESSFVDKIIGNDQTGVLDRGCQCHQRFDQWQTDEKLYVCRIKEKTAKTVIRENTFTPGGIVFYDAVVLLGKGRTQTEKELRVVGYRVDDKDYWVGTTSLLKMSPKFTNYAGISKPSSTGGSDTSRYITSLPEAPMD